MMLPTRSPADRLPALLAAILLTVIVGAAAATPAAAQGFGWFGNLFGGFPRPAPAAPSYPGYGQRQPAERPYARPRRRVARRPAESARTDAKTEAKALPKNASLFVAVFGDSLGQMLGQGLDEALADRADVAVLQKARASTGLVATDAYDWPKAIAELLDKPGDKAAGAKGVKTQDGKAEGGKAQDGKSADGKAGRPAREKIDVAVMMIGINDHQPLAVDGRVLQPGTAEWTAAYARRVTAIDETFRSHAIPLIWVGVPITKDDAFADAMAGLNDVTREAAAKTGATYVDTWEAFSDDNGNFAAYGPDVNGQTVRLRAADGIHFTKAGARKLAHFVEAQVRRALEGKAPPPALPSESADKGSEKAGRQLVAAHPEVGPIRNLNEAPSAADGALAAVRPPEQAGAGDAAGDGAKGDSGPQRAALGDAAPLGRADNARWTGDR